MGRTRTPSMKMTVDKSSSYLSTSALHDPPRPAKTNPSSRGADLYNQGAFTKTCDYVHVGACRIAPFKRLGQWSLGLGGRHTDDVASCVAETNSVRNDARSTVIFMTFMTCFAGVPFKDSIICSNPGRGNAHRHSAVSPCVCYIYGDSEDC